MRNYDPGNIAWPTVSVTLQMGSQGATNTLPPVTLTDSEITSVDHLGQPWNGPAAYPYVPSQDIAILSNSDYGIVQVSCIS